MRESELRERARVRGSNEEIKMALPAIDFALNTHSISQ
jgi:hypothetical protein